MKKYDLFVKKVCYLNPVLCMVRYALGTLFLIIGVAGFFLPIIPGFVFILLGLPLVSAGWVVKGFVALWKRIFAFLFGCFL